MAQASSALVGSSGRAAAVLPGVHQCLRWRGAERAWSRASASGPPRPRSSRGPAGSASHTPAGASRRWRGRADDPQARAGPHPDRTPRRGRSSGMSDRVGSSVMTCFSCARGIARTSPRLRTTNDRYSACPVSMFSSRPRSCPARSTPIVRACPAKSSTTSTSPSSTTMKSLARSPAQNEDLADLGLPRLPIAPEELDLIAGQRRGGRIAGLLHPWLSHQRGGSPQLPELPVELWLARGAWKTPTRPSVFASSPPARRCASLRSRSWPAPSR